MAKAKANPLLPLPIQVDPAFAVGGVAVAAGAGWIWWRCNEQKKLAKALEEDPRVFAVRAYYATSGDRPPPNASWLVQKGGLKKKAREVITYTNTLNAVQGMDVVLAELPGLPAAPPSVVQQLIGQGLTAFEEATGIDVPTSVEREAAGLAQREEAQQADTIWQSASALWTSLFNEQEAKQNPQMSWDYYLGALALE